MRALAGLLLTLTALAALAQTDDSDALLLADQAPTLTERTGDLTASVEAAWGPVNQRYGLPKQHAERASLDLQYDKRFSKEWRVVLSHRLDLNSLDTFKHQSTVNMLREAYASWQPVDDQIVDFGRINARNGVASGYNPTDYFRAGALRSITSLSPSNLRKNRLGSVMLRGQKLWDSGAFTALYSPKLSTHPSDAPFNPDWFATNNKNRWMLSLSQKLSDKLSPQWTMYGEEGQAPQLGTNLTYLANDSTVAFVEWSGGRGPSLQSQALGLTDDVAFRSRIAAGMTYTTENKISYTLEYDYNGAGMNREQWNAVRVGSPATYLRYRSWALNLQDPVVKQSVFLYSTWQDALINRLDATAMVRYNTADHSRLSWLEARYHWDHADLALQWQLNSGDRGSEYGALQQQRSINLVGTYFFH